MTSGEEARSAGRESDRIGSLKVMIPVIGAMLLVAATGLGAQEIVSARAGLLNHVEGIVLVGGRPVAAGRTIARNIELRTLAGRAEVVLSPQTFLRLDRFSGIRLLSTALEDTRVDVLAGSLLLEVGATTKDSGVTMLVDGADLRFRERGAYLVDAATGRVRVFSGHAGVERGGGKMLTLRSGMAAAVALTDMKTEKTPRAEASSFLKWAAERSESLGMANCIATARRDYGFQEPNYFHASYGAAYLPHPLYCRRFFGPAFQIAAAVPAPAPVQGAPTFAVASLKTSAKTVGKDYRKPAVFGPDRVTARNASLKELLVEAYRMQPFQVTGPGWLDADEFDVDARADGPADPEQLRAMLRTLVESRFQIASHTEKREAKIYALVTAKGGAKISAGGEAASRKEGQRHFHGDMRQFADLISVQLSIPAISDPTRPSVASGAPAPVVDRTGLEGEFDFGFEFRPEMDSDALQMWQRILQDQLGLRLENQRATLEFLVVDKASRTPAGN